MRIEVRRNPNWEPGVPLMVFKVEYKLMPGMGYISIVHCGKRQVTLTLDKAKTVNWLWDYPILAGATYRDDFAVNIAIPPEAAEETGIVECTKGIILIPPKEYLFVTVDSRKDYERFINSKEDEVEKEGGILKKPPAFMMGSGWGIA
ncbi:hypothetical protein [Caldivirga sp. MU80]|jgi:hypothetical protein|uniref:hypothetical protein n=1 Tax=Caldivirga sp. MU80 TaxID=1650354 RepID=UPI000829ECA7|nr:hypothetical protein [Caldivirga sp. MU80]